MIPRYISAVGVSEGLFVTLSKFAERFASGPEEFDALFSKHIEQATIGCRHVDHLPKEFQLSALNLQALRAGLTTTNARARFSLDSIHLNTAGLEAGGCGGYELRFRDPRNTGNFWIVYVDFAPGGLEVIGYDLAIA